MAETEEVVQSDETEPKPPEDSGLIDTTSETVSAEVAQDVVSENVDAVQTGDKVEEVVPELESKPNSIAEEQTETVIQTEIPQ